MIEIELLEVAGFASMLRALRLPYSKGTRSYVEAQATYNLARNEFVTGTKSLIHKDDMRLLEALVKNGDEHSKVLRGMIVYLRIKAPILFWTEADTYRIGTDRLSSESTMHTIGNGGLSIDSFLVPDIIREILDGSIKGNSDISPSHIDTPKGITLHQRYLSFKRNFKWLDEDADNWKSALSEGCISQEIADKGNSDMSYWFYLALLYENSIRLINDLAALYKSTGDFEYVRRIKGILPASFIQTRVQMFSYQTLRRIYFQRCNHRLPMWHDFCSFIEKLPFAKELILCQREKK